MSEHDIELLKVRMEGWSRLVQAIFGGIRDIIVAGGVIYTAVATQAMKGDVEVTKQAAVSTNAINTQWIAGKTGEPADIAKAEAAQAVAEKMP